MCQTLDIQVAFEGAKTMTLAPPKGYDSWLDYAVDCTDTRSVELERLFEDGPYEAIPTRKAMRQAVTAELKELQQRAGIRSQHRLS